MKEIESPDIKNAISQRFVLAADLLKFFGGLTSYSKFAKSISLSVQSFNNIKSGSRGTPVEALFRLATAHDVRAEFLLLGYLPVFHGKNVRLNDHLNAHLKDNPRYESFISTSKYLDADLEESLEDRISNLEKDVETLKKERDSNS